MDRQLYRSNIDLAIKHYSSLFKLPSLRCSLILLYLESLLFGFLTKMPSSSFPIWIFSSLLFGVYFFMATILSDYLVIRLPLKKDIILNFRRILFLSFSSNILFIVFMTASNALTFQFQHLDVEIYPKVLSLGFFAALSLRLIVIYSISFSKVITRIFSSILQPLIISSLVLVFHVTDFHLYYVTYFLSALAASILSVQLFTNLLNRDGVKRFGIPSLKIFRAFLADWTESFERPFEEILSNLGEKRDVSISTLIFRGKNNGKLKAIIVVPNLHPGPFKNIGSSPLPGLIANVLERELQCVVSVPHGVSGHELDLASQVDNRIVLRELLNALREPHNFSSKVTKFILVENYGAKVGCQVFNGCAFLTLTMAPETMEDLPLELNDTIIRIAEEIGFSWVIVVDSHNSINGPFDMERTTEFLEDTAISALERAKNLKYTLDTMKVGAGKIIPDDLSLKDGIGPAGITAIVIEVNDQRTAYVTIDGNNMISGLREKILSDLKDLGIDFGEIFTTDTHEVNAVVLTDRGYHPIGEAIDHDKLIGYIKQAVSEAIEKMEPAEVAWLKTDIHGVKVIGEKQINELSLLTHIVSNKAKKSSLIFVFTGFLLVIFLSII
ncbi:MAG: DUF2070 family protein [Candidatus Bathyarchaeia archaeon]